MPQTPNSNDRILTALERLGPNIRLLHGGVSGLELVLRHAEGLEDERVQAALPFLGQIWLYGTAMRDLLNTLRPDGSMLWNAPALAALCRPLQDAFLSLYYFAIEIPEADEAEFRQLLFHRHVAYKRWDLLQRSDQENEEIAREMGPASALSEAAHQAVITHSFVAKLQPNVAKKIRKGGDEYIHEPSDALWARAGLRRELYDTVFRYLSQYAHATPYAVAHLRYNQANHEDGALNMVIPVGLALACVMQTLSYIGELHPQLAALLPPAFHEYVTG